MQGTARQQICDAVTILVRAGVVDYNGHCSCRDGAGFLINSAASDRKAMTPDQVTRVGPDGAVEGDRPPNEAALHAEIYRARPEVGAVVHGHPKWTTLFTLAGVPIPVVMPQQALLGVLPVYPESHSISTPERGRAVAALLGAGKGALLRAHGVVTCGADLVEAVALAIYGEQNAERAYMARALGPVPDLPGAARAEYAQSLAKPALYRKCWDFHLPERTA